MKYIELLLYINIILIQILTYDSLLLGVFDTWQTISYGFEKCTFATSVLLHYRVDTSELIDLWLLVAKSVYEANYWFLGFLLPESILTYKYR